MDMADRKANKNPGAGPGFAAIRAARRQLRQRRFSGSTLTYMRCSAPFFCELHLAGDLREQRVVRADADVRARAHRRAALANEDVAGQHVLAAEALHAQALGVGIAAVPGTAACLFMCHDCCSYKMRDSAGADVRDLHFGELLAMVLLPQVVLAAPNFTIETFAPLPWRTTVADDLAALEQRRAELDVGALADEQHLAELDGCAGLARRASRRAARRPWSLDIVCRPWR